MNTLLLLFSYALTFPQQSDIYLEVVGKADPKQNWAFFAPHENEFVANQYVAKQINQKGGVFIVVRQSGERLIKLKIDQAIVKVDPNRMFTNLGRISSIKKHNPNLDPQSNIFKKSLERTKHLSAFVLTAMGGESKAKTWVAIHNNTNGYDDDGKNGIGNVSIIRYQKKLKSGANYLIDVATSQRDEDDLYFVTDKKDFNAMKKNSWNVVLQHPQVAHLTDEDDGSLSVYAEMKGLRYINIEAERMNNGVGKDHLPVQKQMVDFIFTLLQ